MLSGNLTFIYLEDNSLNDDLNQYDLSASGASHVCYLVTLPPYNWGGKETSITTENVNSNMAGGEM